MTARNPTGFTQWIDHRAFASTGPILASKYDSVLSDQVYVLDAPAVIVSDNSPRVRLADTDIGWITVLRYYPKTKDMCGAVITNNETSHEWCAMVWTSGGGTGEIRVTSAAVASPTSTILIPSSTTPTWRGFGTFNIPAQGSEELLTIDMRHDPAAVAGEELYCGGIGVFALET